MNKSDEGIFVFFSLILVYVGSQYLGNLISHLFGLIFKIVLVSGFLLYFRSWFKFKLKFDGVALLLGLAIAALWVVLDTFYAHTTPVSVIESFSTIDIILKVFIGVVLASIVEEFFTRYFLHRALEEKNWLKLPLGRYDLKPFVITTLFFAFSHSRWLAGLFAGIILNVYWYKKKEMNSIVLTHAFANLFLGVYVIMTGDFSFWM